MTPVTGTSSFLATAPIRESSRSEGRKGTSRREAENLLAQRLGESDDTYTPTRLKKVTVAELIEDLVRKYRINDRKSIGHIQARWKHHLKRTFGDARAVDVTSDRVVRYTEISQGGGSGERLHQPRSWPS